MERVDKFLYDVLVNVLANLVAGGIIGVFLLLVGVLTPTPGLVAAVVSLIVGGLSILALIYGLARIVFIPAEEVGERGKGFLFVLGFATLAAGVTFLASAILNLTWPTILFGVVAAVPLLTGGVLLFLLSSRRGWERFVRWIQRRTARRTARRLLRAQGIEASNRDIDAAVDEVRAGRATPSSAERAGPT